MRGRVLPYTAAETASAASWVPHVSDVLDAAEGDPVGTIVEAIDKLYRRGLVTEAVASLLAEIFDVVPADQLELA